MKGETNHFYQFKSFRLDVEERLLLDNDTPVPLTPKAFDLLALLVTRSGHLVERDELLQTVWADSFVEEANITRTIHTLRKALGDDGGGNKFIKTVAKKGYRFVADVTEASEADWKQMHSGCFERSEQASADSELLENETLSVPPEDGDALQSGRIALKSASRLQAGKRSALKPVKPRVILFTIGFLTAVFLMVFLSFSLRSGGQKQTKSIAVLPVKPINAANRDELYEIGIADSLINRLGTMKGFFVRPLSATRKYADIEQDPIAAGREQQADYVLASNYQLANGKIRLTAQLFNVQSGNIEETKIIEKDASDVFAAQDAIAVEVGKVLSARFKTTLNNQSARLGTTNEEAYRLYVQGRNLTIKGEYKKALEPFEQAIRLDPNYALAYARMAHAYQFGELTRGDVFTGTAKAKEMVKKALELDNNLAEAYMVRGAINMIYEFDFPAAEKDFLRAIELEPNNDTAHWLYALLSANRGQFDQALVEIETAQAIDPSAEVYMTHRGRILYYARRYDEAIVQFKRVLELDGNLPVPYAWLRQVYAAKGNEAEAYEWFMIWQKRINPDRTEIYHKTYETAGWQGVQRKHLEFFKPGENKPGDTFFNSARYCALLGEKDRAFDHLNKAFERRDWLISTLNVDPAFDSLRDDARYEALLKRVGLR